MTQSTYDSFLLYTKNSNNSRFQIVDFETNNNLFLIDKIFAVKKEEQLYKDNLLAKKKEKLDNEIIKFNGNCIIRKSNIIYLTQKRQYKNFHLIALKSVDLTNSKKKIRKIITSKD